MISDKIEAIKAAVNEQLAKSEHLQDVQDIRVKFLGKKGELTAIMKEMKNFSKEERPKVGQLVNTARNAIEEQLKAKMEEVKAQELATKIESEKIDITLPGRKPVMGHEHPLHQTLRLMEDSFLRDIFGPQTKVRFRASYFPFTEPSAEVDISCVMCGGKGCRVCSHTGWLEILGCGMVNPSVLRLNGYDPDVVTGFAFGMGGERIAMLKYGIDDLRLFYENDMRFLNQF